MLHELEEMQRCPDGRGRTHALRWAIFSVLVETARHAGHADIIREQLDGRTGRE